MSKHYFHETSDKFDEYCRVIYCEWCGLVIWDFSKVIETNMRDLQTQAGDVCKANLASERTLNPVGRKLAQETNEKPGGKSNE